jgi:2-C-methyl-D-erythritol 2,4-cyclodiphosphate synthase
MELDQVLSEQLRIGTGVDFHSLYDGYPLTLAGVTIPFDRGFHVKRSDGDPVSHAIVDALLGALGAGDIADWFHDDDGTTDAPSIAYLGILKDKLLAPSNIALINIQVLILAEKPKLKPYFQPIRERIAEQLDLDVERISIQGKTFEGKGIIGQQEGIEAHVTLSLLKRRQQNVYKQDTLVEWAKEQAMQLLSPLGNRWLHVQGVVEQAQNISHILETSEQPYLLAAAYLHDIGYAPSLQITGFHPIDGAKYVRLHHQERLANLVAYHSGAEFEAHLRALGNELHQFTREQSLLADALDYCDMTTGPTGERITIEQRLADIYRRYDETTIVNQAMHQAAPSLKEKVEHVEKLLNEAK